MAGPRTLPLSAGVYVRNNAIADRNGRRGPQALQLSKKKQGSITVLDCGSSICINVDSERDDIHWTTANLIG